jgi:signal transduction histidine kinase
MNKTRALLACVLVLLVASVVVAAGRRIDSAQADEYARDVRRIAAIDARVNDAVLRARFGLVADYDLLVATSREAHRLYRRASQVPSYLDADGRRDVQTCVEVAQSALLAKEALVEQFKSENSVLRNSMRFFPLEAARLDALFAADASTRDLAEAVRATSASVLLYGLFPDRETAVRIDEQRARLREAASRAHRADDTESLLRHLGVILERKPAVDRLASDILASPSSRLAEDLDATYSVAYSRAVRRSTSANTVVFALALCAVVLGALDVILRLRKERERERELVEMKSRFVSMASHEFRTPLSIILSSAELLEEYSPSWPDAKRREHFARIKASVGGMIEMLDAVLTISKADAGAASVSPEPLDVPAFCSDLVASLQASEGKEHRIESANDGDWAGVALDRKHLRHILSNLLSNAIKYSRPGGTVRLRTSRLDGHVVFEVSDEGIGIPEADVPVLFERFHRGANVGEIPGTGLGLAIVKRSVDVCAGSIAVQSKVGEGTRFTVRLPLERASR